MATIDHTAFEVRRRQERLPAPGYVRSAPATFSYLLLLLATTWTLATVTPSVADRLLLESSTNLDRLGQDPIRVLVASAFWVGGWSSLALWTVLFAVVAAPVERRLGSRRTIGIFAAGHVGATLAVALGLWLALHLDAVDRSVAHARDVGASYGFFAVAGVAALLPRGRLRIVGITPLLAALATAAALDPDFTAFGHLAAVAIGLALYPLVRRRAVSSRRRAGKEEPCRGSSAESPPASAAPPG